MPIRIPDNLPAREILEREHIFVMGEERAFHQDIRPLEIAILNLMPLKETTETQLLRLLGNTPLQINITLLFPKNHQTKNTAPEHLQSFYHSFDEIKYKNLDGMIYRKEEDMKDILAKHIVSPVRFEKGLQTMLEMGVDTFIEIGPGKTLAGFMKKINRNVKVLNIEKLEDVERAVQELL